MAEFIPGSRTPVGPPAGPRDLLDGMEGTKYPLPNGSEVELFSIGQLAQALNRKPQAIRKWEAKGIIPRAVYVKPGKDQRGRRRLYSRAQVEAIVEIARQEGVLFDLHRQITRTQFSAKVLDAFKKIAAGQQ